jgi:hypothetical protein
LVLALWMLAGRTSEGRGGGQEVQGAQGRTERGGETDVSDVYAVPGGAKRTTSMRQSRRERKEEMVEQSRERPPTMGRPGLLTFAAIMMFVLGGFHILLAISEFANSTWVLTRLDIERFIPILFIWGVIDLAIGATALYAGVSILRGGTFGLATGFIFASLGMIRWLFHIPVSPVLAVVVIALNTLVIYGLAENADYRP